MSKERLLQNHDAWALPPVETLRKMPNDTIQTYHNGGTGEVPTALFLVATGNTARMVRDYVDALIKIHTKAPP